MVLLGLHAAALRHFMASKSWSILTIVLLRALCGLSVEHPLVVPRLLQSFLTERFLQDSSI